MKTPSENPAPDPLAILKSLELEMEMKREQRRSKRGSRTAVRVASLMFVILLLGIALLVLSHLAGEAREKRARAKLLIPAVLHPASFWKLPGR